jgi:hypothetical protein
MFSDPYFHAYAPGAPAAQDDNCAFDQLDPVA